MHSIKNTESWGFKMTKNMIEIFDLTKIYKLKGKKEEIIALNNVNLSVKEGEILGLIGPNGAGKTTLIHILTTIKQPTSGKVFIDGNDLLKKTKQAKSQIALMLGYSMLYTRITAYANLKFFCKIYNVPNYQEKIHKMAKEFGLEKWLHQYVEHFSTGMRMKLALCRTFLLERKILFLDEPTLGLDVKIVKFLVDKIKESKKTILLTSHNLNVVEKLCDRIAFINKGKILRVGTKDEIKEIITKEIKITVGIKENRNQLKSELNQQHFIDNITNINGDLTIFLKNSDFYKDLLLILGKYDIQKIREHELSLEDLFLKLV